MLCLSVCLYVNVPFDNEVVSYITKSLVEYTTNNLVMQILFKIF